MSVIPEAVWFDAQVDLEGAQSVAGLGVAIRGADGSLVLARVHDANLVEVRADGVGQLDLACGLGLAGVVQSVLTEKPSKKT